MPSDTYSDVRSRSLSSGVLETDRGESVTLATAAGLEAEEEAREAAVEAEEEAREAAEAKGPSNYGTAAEEPETEEEAEVGDIVWNSEPAAEGPIGWVCVEKGEPDVWKAFGTIAG